MKIIRIIPAAAAMLSLVCACALAGEVPAAVRPVIETAPVGESIIYGQSLTESALVGGTALDPDTLRRVEGCFVWSNGDYVPGIGLQTCQCEFVPTGFDAEVYLPVSLRAEVEVCPIPLTVMEKPQCMRPIEYGEPVGQAYLYGGVCTDPSGAEVWGTWFFSDGSTVPPVGWMSAGAVFLPEDSFHYEQAECTVEVECVPCTPDVAVRCTGAGAGQPLSECVLDGWAAGMDGSLIPGVFAFRDGDRIPAGDGTAYDVTFTPDDGVNYLPVTVKVPVTFGLGEIFVEAVLEVERGQAASGGVLTVSAVDAGGVPVAGSLHFDDRFTGDFVPAAGESIGAVFIPFDPLAGGEIPVSVSVVYR